MKKLVLSLLLAVLPLAASAADMTTAPAEVEKAVSEEVSRPFPVGFSNSANAAHFTGDSYVYPMASSNGVSTANVTFYDGAHTWWHIHRNTDQILIAGSGIGYVQIEGQPPIRVKEGDVVVVPAGKRHWHGAAPGRTFQHISITRKGQNVSTEWISPVENSLYDSLK